MAFRRSAAELEQLFARHRPWTPESLRSCLQAITFDAPDLYPPLNPEAGGPLGSLQEAWKIVGGDPLEVLGRLETWALAACASPVPEALAAGQAWRVSALRCRDLLASAFWGNLADTTAERKDRRCRGGLKFYPMYERSSLGAQKLACLWRYFAQMSAEGAEGEAAGREVVVELLARQAGEQLATGWDTEVVVHDGVMEDVSACGFVNFANANFGYGKFIDSCTQEEILQMCCPEFNVGMLVVGLMKDDEVAVVRNCRRFSAYTGYLDTFKYAGPYRPGDTAAPEIQDILTMDATYSRHFAPEMNTRDIWKAVLAFRCSPSVSSGRWGCGVFGGTVDHKMLQQIIAAKAAGCKRLYLSAFKDPPACASGREIARLCAGRGVEDLLDALRQYSNSDRRGVAAFLGARFAERRANERDACWSAADELDV